MAVPDGPIEVWLRLTDLAVTCTVVYEDESTRNLNVQAVSMRGAEHEITDFSSTRGTSPSATGTPKGTTGKRSPAGSRPGVTPTKTP